MGSPHVGGTVCAPRARIYKVEASSALPESRSWASTGSSFAAMAGGRQPLIDYPLGSTGAHTLGLAMPGVQVEAPGFGEFGRP